MGRGFFGSIWYWIFQRPRFCCCLPVRMGVIIMAFVNLVLSAFLSIIIWFEVASTPTLSSKERGSFIALGVVETTLALLSALGFVGAIVRKVTFVTSYCTGLYIHFLINVGVAGYFLAQILHAEHSDAIQACKDAIQDPKAQDQCLSLLGVAKGLYAAIATILLVFELYGALIATRYVHQVKTEKREARRPLHLRGDSDAQRLVPSYVAYSDPISGQTLYDPFDPKGDESRPTSMVSDHSRYSFADGGEPVFNAPDHHFEMPTAMPAAEGYSDAEKGHMTGRRRQLSGDSDMHSETTTLGPSTPRAVAPLQTKADDEGEGLLSARGAAHEEDDQSYIPVRTDPGLR